MSIYTTNETKYLLLTGDSICYNYIRYAVFPNLLGQNIEEIFLSFLLGNSFQCYQHAMELLCNIYMPKCDPESKEIIPPCREMCQDYFNACDSSDQDYINCSYLPSSNESLPCNDQTVTCSSPYPTVQDGTVSVNYTTERTYTAKFS